MPVDLNGCLGGGGLDAQCSDLLVRLSNGNGHLEPAARARALRTRTSAARRLGLPASACCISASSFVSPNIVHQSWRGQSPGTNTPSAPGFGSNASDLGASSRASP